VDEYGLGGQGDMAETNKKVRSVQKDERQRDQLTLPDQTSFHGAFVVYMLQSLVDTGCGRPSRLVKKWHQEREWHSSEIGGKHDLQHDREEL